MHALGANSLLRAAEGDCIVARVDDAIGHGDVAARVDVDSVRVEHPDGIVDLDAAYLGVFTSEKVTAPARRILDGDVQNLDVLGLDKADKLTGAHFFLVLEDTFAVAPTPKLVGRSFLFVNEGMTVSVDCAKTRDCAILDLVRYNEVLTDPLFTGN